MLSYTLPDFANAAGRNLFFARLQAARPDYFRDDVSIDSVYGCFPNCRMNGGRTFIRPQYDQDQMRAIFEAFAKEGVQLRLTFTNMLATARDLDDPYVAAMLRLAREYGGGAIVYADDVRDAIAAEYGIAQTLSTTRPLAGAAEFNQQCQGYDCVVIDYNHAKDPAYLAAIEHPGQAELMVNEFCTLNCPHRLQHYRHNSEDQVNGFMRPFPRCASDQQEFFKHPQGHPVLFTNEEAARARDAYGIERFKIVGRGVAPQTVVEAYCYYLLRPQVHAEVRAALSRQGLC